MHLLSVSAHDIDISGVNLDAELPVAWLDQELQDADATSAAPGRVSVRLSRSGGDIVVRGHVEAKVSMPCARCLAPSFTDVRSELSLLLRPAPHADVHHAARSSSTSAARHTKDAHDAQKAASGRGAGGAGAARGNGAARGAAAAPEGSKGASAKKSSASARDRHAAEDRDSRRRSKDTEYEFSSEEADVDTFDGETVVLDELVREAILLELPNFPLCSEACPGIGRVASAPLADSIGASERVDPRLAPLEALREKLRKTSESEVTEPKSDPGIRARPASRAAARPLLRSSSAATKTKKKKKRNKE